jgi:hypothetical protein
MDMGLESLFLSVGLLNGAGMNLVPEAEQTEVQNPDWSWLEAMAWEMVGIRALSRMAIHASHAMRCRFCLK